MVKRGACSELSVKFILWAVEGRSEGKNATVKLQSNPQSFQIKIPRSDFFVDL